VAATALASWQSGAVWSLGIGLKGIVVLLVVLLLAAVAARRASAGARHLLWSGGIVAILLLPLLSLSLPWRLPVASPLWDAAPKAVQATHLSLDAGPAGHAEDVATATSSRSAADGGISPSAGLTMWLFIAWAAGAASFLAVLGIGALSLRRLVRRATPLDTPDWTRPLVEGADRLGLARLPRLVSSDRVAMPVVCGLFAPSIIVPASATEWGDARRRAVLYHELAHLCRFDLATNLASRLACALHWFNPLVWLAARRVRVEGERACDDLVLRAGALPSEYADHLLQVVCGARHALAPAVAIPMAQPREFEGRMLAILDEGARREQPSRRQALGVAAIAAVLLVPIAAMAPAPAAPASAAPLPAVPAATDSARGPETALAEADDTLRRGQRETERVGPLLAALINALNGSEAGGRLDAARALGAIGSGARLAIPDLGQRLLEDPNPEVRGVSAWAIGQTGSPEGTRYLGAAALRDASEQVRFETVSALGRTGDPTSVSVLAAALGDTSAQVRAVAAWGLGNVRPSSAPPALIAALSDPIHSVQEHAAWALGRIRDSAAVPGLAVLARDVDHYSKVGFEALWALAQIGGDAARPALAEALRTQQMDPHLRDVVEAALAGRRVEGLPRPSPRRDHM